MKSARKWEMIHPNYKGSDGELLWHVYYGDFSDDERFDGFRKNELWDADVIRPIIEMDLKFERYQDGHQYNKGRKDKSGKVLARESSTPAVPKSAQHSHYAVWLVLLSVALIGAFAYWYKYKRGDSKLFNQVEAKSLLNRTRENECYVY